MLVLGREGSSWDKMGMCCDNVKPANCNRKQLFSSVLDLVLVLKSKRFMTTFEFIQWYRVALNFAGYNFWDLGVFSSISNKTSISQIFFRKNELY